MASVCGGAGKPARASRSRCDVCRRPGITQDEPEAANVNDVVEGNSLLHGCESDVFADAGYKGPTSGLAPRKK